MPIGCASYDSSTPGWKPAWWITLVSWDQVHQILENEEQWQIVLGLWDQGTLWLLNSHTQICIHTYTIQNLNLIVSSVKVHVGELGSGLRWTMAGGRSTHITARSGGCHQRGTLCSDVRGHLYIALAPGTQRRAVWTTCLVQHRCGSTCSHSHLCWWATGVSLCHPTGKTTVPRHPINHPPHKTSLYVLLFQCA